MGVELYGKILGIIGLGRIGSNVAKMARSFGMKIIAFDPFISTEAAEKSEIELVELNDLIRQADFITVHTPKSNETKSLISEKEFAKMKKGVRVINCARGGIIDELALAKALKEGKVSGCALDVFEEEPPPADHPLFKFDNCIATPHLGASTSEAQVNVAIEIAETIKNALLGKGIVNAANFPSVDAVTYKTLEPYINLGERMGRFAGQLINGRLSEIKISYSGVVTQYKVAPISMAMVYGLLSPILGETVNFINALDVAKERAIKIQEVQLTKEQEFVNLLSVKVITDKETFSLWGTLSGNRQPRIVKINNVYMEASPNGYMLFINNNDKPGIVGAIGDILAKNKINIAGITLGRESKGGLAVSVVNVDSKVSDKVLEDLRKTKDILFVKLIKV